MNTEIVVYTSDMIGGESILNICPYGENRSSKVLEYHKKVFEYFQIPCNYFSAPFPAVSHGSAVNQILKAVKDHVDYVIFWDMDCIPLRNDVMTLIHDKIKDKETLFGGAFQSNHKKGPDGTFNHPYCGPPVALSMDLYKKLGEPDCDHHSSRSDTFEELTWSAEEKGFNICIVWPSNVVGMTEEQRKDFCPTNFASLGNGHKFGYGTTYGQKLFYHQMCAPVKEHEKDFIETCNLIINK